MAGKLQNLNITIAGVLDPSLIAAINKTEQQLKQLGASVRTSNAAMKNVYAAAFPAPAHIQQSINKVNQFSRAFGNLQQGFVNLQKGLGIKDIAGGILLGQAISKGFEMAAESVKKFGDALKSASDAAANMEIQRSNLQAATQLNDKQMQDLQGYFWQKSIQVPVTVPTQMAGFKRIEEAITESDPMKRIALGKAESNKLLDIAALAVNPAKGGNVVDEINEKYRDVVDVVTKAQMYGIINQRVLSEFETMGINLRPGMMAETGLISKEQLSHWSSMDEGDRDKLLGEFAKDVKKRTVIAKIINDQITQLTSPGGKAFGRAASIAGTMGGVESSTADVINFFNTMVGQIENGPLKQLLSAINTGFASQIPMLTEMFGKLAAAANEGFKPILATLEKADWNKIGQDIKAVIEALAKMFEKAQPIFQWMAKDLPEEIDTLARITTAIEKVATAIEKAFGWALHFGDKIGAATSVTAGDRLSTAQDRLSGLQSAGASDDQILAAKKELMDAEKAQKESLEKLQTATDKTVHNDFFHLNLAIDSCTEKLLKFAGSVGGPGGASDSVLSLSSGYSGGSSASARGMLTAFGEQIPFGSGGYRGSAPIPYGDYPMTPGSIGAWGQSHGALGINGGTIWDPTLGRNREGIEMHAGGSNLISEGCVVVPKSKWPALKKKIIDDYEKGNRPTLHVGKEGASISDKPTTQINVHIHAIDSDSFAQTIHKHSEIIADHVHRVLKSEWERSSVV